MLNSLDHELGQANRISGCISNQIIHLTALVQLNVRNQHSARPLSGTLVAVTALDLPLLSNFVFTRNLISGTLNFAVSHFVFLEAESNKLSGTVAPVPNIQDSILRNLFRECHYLRLHLIRAVQVSDNQVSGTLSVYGQRTRNVFMATNSFSGEIPAGA